MVRRIAATPRGIARKVNGRAARNNLTGIYQIECAAPVPSVLANLSVWPKFSASTAVVNSVPNFIDLNTYQGAAMPPALVRITQGQADQIVRATPRPEKTTKRAAAEAQS